MYHCHTRHSVVGFWCGLEATFAASPRVRDEARGAAARTTATAHDSPGGAMDDADPFAWLCGADPLGSLQSHDDYLLDPATVESFCEEAPSFRGASDARAGEGAGAEDDPRDARGEVDALGFFFRACAGSDAPSRARVDHNDEPTGRVTFPGGEAGPAAPASALAPRARAGAGAGAGARRALDDVELSTIARALFFDDAALFAIAPPAAGATPAEALGHVEATPRSPFRPDLPAADDDARERLDRDKTDDLLRSMGAAKDEATAAARRHASTARAAARMIAAADAGYALPPFSSPEKLPPPSSRAAKRKVAPRRENPTPVSNKPPGPIPPGRSSRFRGVTKHRWTGRFEAHLWDSASERVNPAPGRRKKGRQVYLGGYATETEAARAYDKAAIKHWGAAAHLNFSREAYAEDIAEIESTPTAAYVASLRRASSGFSRGASKFRGVTRHHQHDRWEARIGRVMGNRYLYLGTFPTEEEAARAYDRAALTHRGPKAVTNFDRAEYDVYANREVRRRARGGGQAPSSTARTIVLASTVAEGTNGKEAEAEALESSVLERFRSVAGASRA